jgi:hypothetical protein
METKKILIYGGVGLGALLVLKYFMDKKKQTGKKQKQRPGKPNPTPPPNPELVKEISDFNRIKLAETQKSELMEFLDKSRLDAQRSELDKFRSQLASGMGMALTNVPEAKIKIASAEDYLRYAEKARLTQPS